MTRLIGISIGLNAVIFGLAWTLTSDRTILPILFALLVAFDALKYIAVRPKLSEAAVNPDRQKA